MLTDRTIERLERGDRLDHVLGTEMVFISLYPTVEHGMMYECRFQDKDGNFKLDTFYSEELKLPIL